MARKRTLMQVTVGRSGKELDDTQAAFSSSHQLPLGSATARDAETCAAFLLKAANAQLDYSKSTVRLRGWDTVAKKWVDFVEQD